jgi:RNA polymerase subunit RPABC4/transcription elongation factor Spt4
LGIFVVVLISLFLLGGVPTPHGTAASVSATGPSAASLPPPQIVTHGDLVVQAGETVMIQPTSSSQPYYQAGNITVESGGTLIVENTTLSVVQFVSDVGTPIQRLSHIYHFVDQGTVLFDNATLTTDANILNDYPKLNVTVEDGVMTLDHSSFEFPGWLNVEGSSAVFTANQSTITNNSAVAALDAYASIAGDVSYAPAVTVSGGAQFTLLQSFFNNTYSDNLTANGVPGPTIGYSPPSGQIATINGGGFKVPGFNLDTDSEALVRDWLNPSGPLIGGVITVVYNTTSNDVSSTPTLTINGNAFPFNYGFNFTEGYNLVVSVPILSSAVAYINSQGVLNFLNFTGSFGTGASLLNLSFGPTTGPVNVSEASITLYPELNYNLNVSGPGTIFTAADTAMDLTWALPAPSPVQFVPPYPWYSNKVVLSGGADGYFGNLSTYVSFQGAYDQTSVVQTQGTSNATFYRWAALPITGKNHVPIPQAMSQAFYAYSSVQANNATAAWANQLSVASPVLWKYVNWWDGTQGIREYGASSARGVSYRMLASGQVNASSLPGANFLGAYHIAVSTPSGGAGSTRWFNWSVTPFPYGLTYPASVDFGPTTNFPQYTQAIALFDVDFGMAGTINVVSGVYTVSGKVSFNGSEPVLVNVTAIPSGGQPPILIAQNGDVTGGSFSFAYFQLSQILGPGTYTLSITGYFNGATSPPIVSPSTVTVPGSSASAPGILFQKFLGLPLWMLLGIVAAVIAILLALFLVVIPRQARGKLVECGECGELIPADALICPKCGAEFEADLVRCSRCSATIPANSEFCPECSAQLLGKPGAEANDPERQGYTDFVERFRADAKRELGDNYSEGAFWDWWKRQPTYVPYSQWRMQQGQGASRAGMSAPPAASAAAAPTTMPPPVTPPAARGGTGGGATMMAGGAPTMYAPSPSISAGERMAGTSSGASPATSAGPAPPGVSGLKPCPNCGKEVPPEYLVCPFCGAVTQ